MQEVLELLYECAANKEVANQLVGKITKILVSKYMK